MVVPFYKNSQQLWLPAQDQASQHSCMEWGGKCTQAPTCSWGVPDIWWLLVLCLVFFRGVVPGSFPMPRWKATPMHMRAPLIQLSGLLKRVAMKFRGRCVCVTWNSWRWEVGSDPNKLHACMKFLNNIIKRFKKSSLNNRFLLPSWVKTDSQARTNNVKTRKIRKIPYRQRVWH